MVRFILPLLLLALAVTAAAENPTADPAPPVANAMQQARSLADLNSSPIQDNSFLIEEAYNQEAGVVQHINLFQRNWRTGEWLGNYPLLFSRVEHVRAIAAIDEKLSRQLAAIMHNPEFLELSFPPRYRHDVLRALDYFRASGARPDPRMAEAVRFLEGKQDAEGRWPLDRAHDEPLDFRWIETVGAPSRWNTLRALRVLRWYGQEVSPDKPARE